MCAETPVQVLHQRKKDEKFYAIKILNKSRLSKLRVSPTETAMMDVQREVTELIQPCLNSDPFIALLSPFRRSISCL